MILDTIRLLLYAERQLEIVTNEYSSKGTCGMITIRVVAKCGSKARAKTRTEKEIPAKGDYYYLSPEVGEVVVTDTSPGEGIPVVVVTVTAAAFKHLTLGEGWSAVE